MTFQIDVTKITPYVLIDKGEIIIHGRSIPEDSFEFYEPVVEACMEYIRRPAKHTEVRIHLDYVNSGSKKYLTNILTILEKSYLSGYSYEIIWIYDIDDEAIYDLGNDLKSIIKIPLKIESSS
jgi:hypothetical protein